MFVNKQFVIQFEEWINLCIEFEENRDRSKKYGNPEGQKVY